MAVTDLTNTTWIFNSTINVTTSGTFNIDFISNLEGSWVSAIGRRFIKLTTGSSPSGTYKNALSYYYNFAAGVIAAEVYTLAKSGSTDNKWYGVYKSAKRIDIIGGQDVKNSTLISWLQANATQIIDNGTTARTYMGNTQISKYVGSNTISFKFGNNSITSVSTASLYFVHQKDITWETLIDNSTYNYCEFYYDDNNIVRTYSGKAVIDNDTEENVLKTDIIKDGSKYHEYENTCILEGTPIMLANGTTKNVEDITYSDLLIYRDFYTGEFKCNYPLAIIQCNPHYQEENTLTLHLSNGEDLTMASKHYLWNYTTNSILIVNCFTKEVNADLDTLILSGIDYNTKQVDPITVVSYEWSKSNKKQYTIEMPGCCGCISSGVVNTTSTNEFIPVQSQMKYNQYVVNSILVQFNSEADYEREWVWYNQNVTDLYEEASFKNSLTAYQRIFLDTYSTPEQAAEIYKAQKAYIQTVYQNSFIERPSVAIVNEGGTITNVNLGSTYTIQSDCYSSATFKNYTAGDVITIHSSVYLEPINN